MENKNFIKGSMEMVDMLMSKCPNLTREQAAQEVICFLNDIYEKM